MGQGAAGVYSSQEVSRVCDFNHKLLKNTVRSFTSSPSQAGKSLPESRGDAGAGQSRRRRTGRRGLALSPEFTGVRKDSSWLRAQSLDRRRLVSNKFGIEGLSCGVDRPLPARRNFLSSLKSVKAFQCQKRVMREEKCCVCPFPVTDAGEQRIHWPRGEWELALQRPTFCCGFLPGIESYCERHP